MDDEMAVDSAPHEPIPDAVVPNTELEADSKAAAVEPSTLLSSEQHSPAMAQGEDSIASTPVGIAEIKLPEEKLLSPLASEPLIVDQPRPPTPISATGAAGPAVPYYSQVPHPGYNNDDGDAPASDRERPLNVTDALGYLDAVKVQFQDKPDVYNHFLDIMKEFKSQMIDTPGVIQRVSQLFNGHPFLIQGFNTFLPAGYRIECSTDAQDANHIVVTTPSGATIESTNDGESGIMQWATSSPHVEPSEVAPPTEIAIQPGPDGQPSFEPALQYVQTIKQRCSPDVYKEFLDILSRYHKNDGLMDEEAVSKHIAKLFRDSPDLQAGFRVFMPDRSMDDINLSRAPTPSAEIKGKRKIDALGSSATSASAPAAKRSKRKDKDAGPPKASSSNAKKSRQTPTLDPALPYNSSKYPAGPSTDRRSGLQYPQNQIPASNVRTVPPNDDTLFFERVKRTLDNRDTYNEFLKVVNLFTQGFIDTARLVKESSHFLVGDGTLLRQFKDILGWDEKKERESWLLEQQAQFGWSRPTIAGFHDRPTRADMSTKYGSYRKLPANEVNVPCSGRDEMCKAVLNDEWVAHLAPDDVGFFSAPRNIYEEALHRTEEERHEYDFHIEAIVRTIALLEPINNKIAVLPPDERGSFKLKPNLGGSAKAIHHRVIKKIYGRETGLEVIQTMQDSPALAIPVVVQRLKQKEEEWKRAQREWIKVWREVDARNYAKSLDPQSISFKMADKKAITPKAFVSQIEASREDQQSKLASLIDPLFARTRPRYQLQFVVDDVAVLQDALKLVFSFLDRTQAQINSSQRRRIEVFLRTFIPLFFMLDPTTFNAAFVVAHETGESEMSDIDALNAADDMDISSASGSSKTGKARKGAGSSGGDLRKKLLKSEQAKSSTRKTRARDGTSPPVSRVGSPIPVDESSTSKRVSRNNFFFTNTTFYVLLRILEVLYSRLACFKTLGQKLAEESNASGVNPIANHLGISAPEIIKLGDRTAGPEHFYELMLESCELLFDNQLETMVFEDQMRYMFGIQDAFKIFTIDKVIGALIKQVQAVFADPKSQELLEILKRDRSITYLTTQDQLNSRVSTEKALGPDENLFRVDWLGESKTMTIQLLGKDESSFEDTEVQNGRWQAYIDSYVSEEQTESVSQNKVKRPFLRRNLPSDSAEKPELLSADGLEIKVCVRTYRIFYVSKTEDYLYNIQPRRKAKTL
ncbi:histone deacetylase complex, SIN3 component [Mycena floridula]|nr:histone deacetylase complex, SIN3 component [Mycena floridula]